MFSRGFATFVSSATTRKNLQTLPMYFSQQLFRKFDLQNRAVKEDCIFVRLVKFHGRHRCLKIYHLVFFPADSFDDAAIFIRVFCDPFCAFSVRLPGGSLGLFVTRFAAVVWLETGSLVMFNTIKIATTRHNHGISDLHAPKSQGLKTYRLAKHLSTEVFVTKLVQHITWLIRESVLNL